MHGAGMNGFGYEWKKAVHNRFFWIALFVGTVFCIMSALYCIDGYYYTLLPDAQLISGNPMLQGFGLYNNWIGGESFSLGYFLFFTLLPLLSTLPYGWSFCEERNSGYVKMAMLQMGRRKYFLSKYAAAFLAGGAAVVIPLLINLILVACFVPAVTPSIIYEIYYPVHYGTLWSELFFTSPLRFVIRYLIMDFVFAGLFATVGIALAFFIKQKAAVILIPYFAVLGIHYLRTSLYGSFYKEISPLNFLHATCIENYADPLVILGELLLFTLIPASVCMVKGMHYEDI